jgi:hypothetical protein
MEFAHVLSVLSVLRIFWGTLSLFLYIGGTKQLCALFRFFVYKRNSVTIIKNKFHYCVSNLDESPKLFPHVMVGSCLPYCEGTAWIAL